MLLLPYYHTQAGVTSAGSCIFHCQRSHTNLADYPTRISAQLVYKQVVLPHLAVQTPRRNTHREPAPDVSCVKPSIFVQGFLCLRRVLQVSLEHVGALDADLPMRWYKVVTIAEVTMPGLGTLQNTCSHP